MGSFSLSTIPLVGACAGYIIEEVNERASLIDWNIVSEGRNQRAEQMMLARKLFIFRLCKSFPS